MRPRDALAALAMLALLAAATAPAAADGELVLKATLGEAAVRLGDDFVIDVTVENQTARTVVIPELRIASDSVMVDVSGAGLRASRITRRYGQFVRDGDEVRFETAPTRRVAVAPGKSRSASIRFPAVAGERLSLRVRYAVTEESVLEAEPLSLSLVAGAARRLQVRAETSRQPFTIDLDGAAAFNSVGHFWALVRDGFYTDLPFHRVVPGLLVQTGDPRGDGTGDPGYFLPLEAAADPFARGVVGLARGAHPDSAGSQWFVVATPPGGEVDAQAFAGGFTALGRVSENLEAVDGLALNELLPDSFTPRQPDRVVRATVRVR